MDVVLMQLSDEPSSDVKSNERRNNNHRSTSVLSHRSDCSRLFLFREKIPTK